MRKFFIHTSMIMMGVPSVTLLLLLIWVSLLGCRPNYQIGAGTIELELVVYNAPKENLYDSYRITVSTLFFCDGKFIEMIPYENVSDSAPRFTLIKEDRFVPVVDLQTLTTTGKSKPLSSKKYGAAFIDCPVPFYEKRKNMRDTVFNSIAYHRIKIISDCDYSVFYVHRTDSVLPYSLCPQIDRDYHGRLERIDSYDFVSGKFFSLRMLYKNQLPETIYNVLKK